MRKRLEFKLLQGTQDAKRSRRLEERRVTGEEEVWETTVEVSLRSDQVRATSLRSARKSTFMSARKRKARSPPDDRCAATVKTTLSKMLVSCLPSYTIIQLFLTE